MEIINIFHYISHARWIFFIWSMFLAFSAYMHPSPHLVSNVGLAVFLMGLFLGFWGFSDIEKLSNSEKKEFANPKNMKINIILCLVAAFCSFIGGIYFMNIKSMQPSMKEDIAIEMSTVGYHCFALGFGVFCFLKMRFDKYKYFKSLPENK